MIDGIKKCKATIVGIENGKVEFKLHNTQNIEVGFADIKEANLLVDETVFKK